MLNITVVTIPAESTKELRITITAADDLPQELFVLSKPTESGADFLRVASPDDIRNTGTEVTYPDDYRASEINMLFTDDKLIESTRKAILHDLNEIYRLRDIVGVELNTTKEYVYSNAVDDDKEYPI